MLAASGQPDTPSSFGASASRGLRGKWRVISTVTPGFSQHPLRRANHKPSGSQDRYTKEGEGRGIGCKHNTKVSQTGVKEFGRGAVEATLDSSEEQHSLLVDFKHQKVELRGGKVTTLCSEVYSINIRRSRCKTVIQKVLESILKDILQCIRSS